MTRVEIAGEPPLDMPAIFVKFKQAAALAAALLFLPTIAFSASETTTTQQHDAATSMALHPLNPIRLSDTPDPGVIRHDGKWYICHTSSGRRHAATGRYPIIVSDDLTSWEHAGYILPFDKLPAWCDESLSWWAPEFHKVGDRYIAYFTARENGTERFCIGAAIAKSPGGPYEALDKPIHETPGVGLIDVSWFEDPNTNRRYLLWKEDRNDFDPPEPTPLLMQEMTTDGLKVTGEPREILRNDREWEAMLVEAPSLVYHDGWYYLFYSGNMFSTDDYAVGVARSRNVWGPYEKKIEPILTDDEDFSGPGHQFVIQDENGTWHMFYHARLKKLERSYRYLMHDIITWDADGWPRVNDGHPGPARPDAVQRVLEIREEIRRNREAETTGTANLPPQLTFGDKPHRNNFSLAATPRLGQQIP